MLFCIYPYYGNLIAVPEQQPRLPRGPKPVPRCLSQAARFELRGPPHVLVQLLRDGLGRPASHGCLMLSESPQGRGLGFRFWALVSRLSVASDACSWATASTALRCSRQVVSSGLLGFVGQALRIQGPPRSPKVPKTKALSPRINGFFCVAYFGGPKISGSSCKAHSLPTDLLGLDLKSTQHRGRCSQNDQRNPRAIIVRYRPKHY